VREEGDDATLQIIVRGEAMVWIIPGSVHSKHDVLQEALCGHRRDGPCFLRPGLGSSAGNVLGRS
jgi:hypothetical protein